jgi:hypothetical protein
MIIGCEDGVVKRLDPIFWTLAPRIGAISRTPGREQLGGACEQGYLHCGPSGAGHFVKMVRNGIEYGIMAAFAEGLGILRNANAGKRDRGVDAETSPLRHPEHYQNDMNLRDIAEVWRRGSVIVSWLLDLTAISLVHRFINTPTYPGPGKTRSHECERCTHECMRHDSIRVRIYETVYLTRLRFGRRALDHTGGYRRIRPGAGSLGGAVSAVGDALRLRRLPGKIARQQITIMEAS